MLDFLNIDVQDILDICLMGILIFYAFRLLKGSQAFNIFIMVVMLYAIRFICSSLGMKLTSSLLGALLDVGLIALIIIFQPEIRRFLYSMGRSYSTGMRSKILAAFIGRKDKEESAETINEISKACEEMSRDKCGALIVIQKSANLNYIVSTGDVIDAKVSKRLLMNLFFKNSPLHDGAVIIDGERVVAARCTLPITEQETPASFGMRHKAAIGISENTDAIVVVVSEENGHVCVMRGGKTRMMDNINDLKLVLQNG